MKLIKESKERSWYLVKEWVTESGLKARVCQCVWNDEVQKITSLDDHFTGYVKVPEGLDFEVKDIDVHGGVTFDNTIDGEEGRWIGFDYAHYGDEGGGSLEEAERECELLATQLK